MATIRQLLMSAIALLAVLGTAKSIGAQSQIRFGECRIIVPSGWTQVPDDVLQELTAAAQGPASKSVVKYDAAFQLEDTEYWLEYPYVLVQVHSYQRLGLKAPVSDEDFVACVRTLTGFDQFKLLDESVSTELRPLVSDWNVQQPRLDAPGRRFILDSEMTIDAVGTVRMSSLCCFGAQGLTQVMFYSLASQWDSHQRAREQILGSVEKDPVPVEFAGFSQMPPTTNSPESQILSKGAIGAVVGGLMALVLGGIAHSKREPTKVSNKTGIIIIVIALLVFVGVGVMAAMK